MAIKSAKAKLWAFVPLVIFFLVLCSEPELALLILIPIIVLGILYVRSTNNWSDEFFKTEMRDNSWAISIVISGPALGIVLCLDFLTGYMTLPAALALGAPMFVFGGLIALIFAVTGVVYKIMNRKENNRDNMQTGVKVSEGNIDKDNTHERGFYILGIGFGPLPKRETNAIFEK